MIDPKEPLEFSCMDDSPFNNGWGYNAPEPIEEEEEEIDENDCNDTRED
jgi:hypothetical protein